MNWGWKIVLLYSLFVIMTLSMVFFFMGHKVDLVSTEYYKQEIEYQKQIDKIANANILTEPIGYEYIELPRTVKLSFPMDHVQRGLSGKIHFYRPANSNEDKKFDITVNETGEQTISISNLSKGFWKIKISWNSGNTEFYTEKKVTL